MFRAKKPTLIFEERIYEYKKNHYVWAVHSPCNDNVNCRKLDADPTTCARYKGWLRKHYNTLYTLPFGAKTAIAVSLVRVLLVSLLFGNFLGLAYSLAGAVLSLAVMILLKKTDLFSTLGVSVVGGIAHNAGQITVACILMSTSEISYYMPVLIITGTVAGIVVGIASHLLIKKTEKFKF